MEQQNETVEFLEMSRPCGAVWFAFSPEGYFQAVAESKKRAQENLKNKVRQGNVGLPEWFLRPGLKFSGQEFRKSYLALNPTKYVEHNSFAKIPQLYNMHLIYAPGIFTYGVVLVLEPKLKTNNHLQFYHAENKCVRLAIDECIERMHLHYMFQTDLSSFQEYHQDSKKTVWLMNTLLRLPKVSFKDIIHLED